MSGGNKKIKILGLGHDHAWAAWQETQAIPAGIEIVEFCWRSGLDEFITMVHSHQWDLALVDYRHLQAIPAFAGSSISPYIAHHITLAFLLRDEEEYRRFLLEGNAEIPVVIQREDPLALANAIHCYLHKLRIAPAIEQIKHYLQLLNLSHEAILFFNGRGDIFFANNAASQLYEQAPQHLIMKNIFSLFPEDCHQELHDLITQTRHNHYGKTSLIFTRDAEKTHRFKRISLNTYRIDSASSNCDAELLQIAMLIKPDDLQQISQSVLQSVQRLSHIKVLLQGCVHDLNNILSPITLGTFLLRARTNDPQLEAAIDRIEESAERGSELIHQIQAIAENTSIPHIQAKHILRAIMHAFRNSVPPDIQVLWEIPREFPVLKIDVLEFE
ncbi:MAG: PAS domain-containing protein, partial [Lentisphaerae bacterium]